VAYSDCGVPFWATRPSCITAIWSDKASASSWSCVTNTVVMRAWRAAVRQDHVAHGQAQLGVQVGQRLVHQQHARLDDHRTRQRHALALAAAELRRKALRQRLQADLFERLFGALLHFIGRPLACAQAVGHVVEHRLVGEQRVVLEHHADVALVGRHGRDVVAVEEDAPAFWVR
jgi:hypothetical protein